jgi:hypothetical protein
VNKDVDVALRFIIDRPVISVLKPNTEHTEALLGSGTEGVEVGASAP